MRCGYAPCRPRDELTAFLSEAIVNNLQRTSVTFRDIERRLISEHHKPYYDWIRHVVTLALAALTSLVALQGHYVPAKPIAPFLLASGWIALALTIASGLIALRSEYWTPLAAAQKIRLMRAQLGDEAAAAALMQNSTTYPGRLHRLAVGLMVTCFVVALISICAFSVVNLRWA